MIKNPESGSLSSSGIEPDFFISKVRGQGNTNRTWKGIGS
jgi:hypothetical protein